MWICAVPQIVFGLDISSTNISSHYVSQNISSPNICLIHLYLYHILLSYQPVRIPFPPAT